jgi:hypothetical protein
MGARPLRARAIGRDNWDLPVVSADAAGRVVAAWTWEQPRRGAGSDLRPRVVVVATRAASGHWSRPRRVSPLPSAPPHGGGRGPELSATTAAVALGGRGVAVVAWQREGAVEACLSRDGGRSFGPVRRLGPTSFAHPRPGVAVSSTGVAGVAWSVVAGTGAPGGVQAALWPADGALGPAEDVAGGASHGLRLAAAGAGLTGVWLAREGGRDVVRAADRPAAERCRRASRPRRPPRRPASRRRRRRAASPSGAHAGARRRAART